MADTAQYYDGTRLLSMKDINGREPEIYMVTTNRTGGKTYWFSKLLVNRWIKHKKKFMLIYRFKNELDNVASKFFKDIGKYEFPEYSMTSVAQMDGSYHSLLLDDQECGYAVALNAAEQIKRLSHLFSDTSAIFFDEFQSETNHYCSHEIDKFLSVHTSVARGQGEQARYVPVYMAANPVSLINPYYTEMDISKRLRSDTKFLRGDGFVLEQGFVESASRAQLDTGVSRAFKHSRYVDYAHMNVYLNDALAFIERPEGRSVYLATIKYKNKNFGVREFTNQGIIYCDDRPDMSANFRIALTTDDHEVNYVMLKRNEQFISIMRYYFEKGAFRFKDLSCKECILKAISY